MEITPFIKPEMVNDVGIPEQIYNPEYVDDLQVKTETPSSTKWPAVYIKSEPVESEIAHGFSLEVNDTFQPATADTKGFITFVSRDQAPLNKPMSNSQVTNANKTEVKFTKVNGFYACNACDYKTVKSSRLKRHMQTHVRLFRCKRCQFTTGLKCELTQHKIIHAQEKLFKCTRCDYTAVRKTTLQQHELIHSGEKAFECTECDYKSAVRGNLQRHVVTHTGEKILQCSLCEYKASRQDTLRNHMRKHTKEKPYKCSECSFTTARKNYLPKHMMIHTGEKWLNIECQYDDSFKTSASP